MALNTKKRTIVQKLTADTPPQPAAPIANLVDLFNRRVESPSIRRMLLAAVDHFAKTGFHASTTRDIAKKAKLSPAAVYVHFRSKEELLFTVVTIISEWVLDQMIAAVHKDDTTVERLQRMVRVHVSCHTAMRTAVYVANYEFSSLNVVQRKKILRIRDSIEEMFRSCLQDGVDDGSFRVPDVGIAMVAIVSLCVSVLNWYAPRGKLSPDQVGDLYAELVLSMVNARRSSTA